MHMVEKMKLKLGDINHFHDALGKDIDPQGEVHIPNSVTAMRFVSHLSVQVKYIE